MKSAMQRAHILYTIGQGLVDTVLAVSACLVIYWLIIVAFSL